MIFYVVINDGDTLACGSLHLSRYKASPSSSEIADEQNSPEGRYDLLESVSFAFLLALEALTPQQRAVLLLRDVFDYSVQETAEALALSATNVKTIRHRARRIMQSYDCNRCIPTRTLQGQTRRALEQFLLLSRPTTLLPLRCC